MNSLILCEGKTDCILLQYYLEKVHRWKYKDRNGIRVERDCWSNCFTKDEHTLNIAETKGCSRLVEGLISAIIRNENAAPGSKDEFFDKIIIFTDNDEVDTSQKMICDIIDGLSGTTASFSNSLEKGTWNKGSLKGIDGIKEFELLLLFIPFDENGALETYLLNCIRKSDAYDRVIIDKGNSFVDMIDPESKYLTQRRLKTKAKFDVYFSVRTSAEQYAQRQNILRSVAWENYDTMREDFKVFADLG